LRAAIICKWRKPGEINSICDVVNRAELVSARPSAEYG